MERNRQELLRTAEGIPDQQWRQPPRPGSWSAAEIIAHLTMVEGAIAGGAAKVIRGDARPLPLWRRVHVPVFFAEWRGIKRQTPIPLDPSLIGDKRPMLEALAAVRQQTLAFLQQNAARDLRGYHWPHPFFGPLNLYAWFEVVARHEARHTKQLREIVELFQK